MKNFTIAIDSKLNTTLEDLKQSTGKTSKAEVFRLAITLLKIAHDAKQEGLKLTLSDEKDCVRKEIVLPLIGRRGEGELR